MSARQNDSDRTGERVAAYTAWSRRSYESRPAPLSEASTWVQVDLGSTRPIDTVRLYPSHTVLYPGNGFPLRFRIECSTEPDLANVHLIADRSATDYPDPGDQVVEFRSQKVVARYVRLTAVRLRKRRAPDLPLKTHDLTGEFVLSLAKLSVLFERTDIAVGERVMVDPLFGCETSAQQLTRPSRPLGEGVVTDSPGNVTAPATWRPHHYKATSPQAGVSLEGGLFATALNHNIEYLLESFSTDDLLRQFRVRAGKPIPPSKHEPHPFWEEELAGSAAGRFLMGAANAVRWIEHAELCARVGALVEGIAQCRQSNGYIMAYPESAIFVSELGAYTRSWLTHGLINAGHAGHPKAFELLRGYYDWLNASAYLPELLRRCNQGGQAMVAHTRMYFTPCGAPTDIEVVQRYFQENYWLEDLAQRRPEAIWQYPYDRPHCFLLTNLEAYLDLYRATGEPRYLHAVEGGWDLFRDNWQHIGGSISIIETECCAPKSNKLHAALGETCGSVFWILLNQRLHGLYPDQEKYVAEIEKSIYNVLLANVDGARGFRYHTLLGGQKEASRRVNTCCEGQGTRLIGSLPEYIYSIAPDGLYVNLYEPSMIEWRPRGDAPVKVRMRTAFPQSGVVELQITTAAPQQFKLHIRVPSWAKEAVTLHVNDTESARGQPGTYVTLDRHWKAGDRVSFELPMGFTLTRYTGLDQVVGRERFALEYGPLLMAAVGMDSQERILLLDAGGRPTDLLDRLRPDAGNGAHFAVSSFASRNTRFIPYHEVGSETFTCFPFVESRTGFFSW